ncbi:MAG TPA: hypothetical protein GX004_07745 [Firmicutes bacterium]|nr:hypothetical protein [Bacillota bacterium]
MLANSLQTVTVRKPFFTVESYLIKGERGLRELLKRLAVRPVSRFLFCRGGFGG